MFPAPVVDYQHANNHLRSVVDKLNAILEARIIDILKHSRRRFPPPAESVLVLGEPWSSNSTFSRTDTKYSLSDTTDPLPNRSEDLPDPRSTTSSNSVSSTTTSTTGSVGGKHQRSEDIHAVRALSSPQLTVTFRFLSSFLGEHSILQAEPRTRCLYCRNRYWKALYIVGRLSN